jgi:hypothetical protein
VGCAGGGGVRRRGGPSEVRNSGSIGSPLPLSFSVKFLSLSLSLSLVSGRRGILSLPLGIVSQGSKLLLLFRSLVGTVGIGRNLAGRGCCALRPCRSPSERLSCVCPEHHHRARERKTPVNFFFLPPPLFPASVISQFRPPGGAPILVACPWSEPSFRPPPNSFSVRVQVFIEFI